MGKDADDLYAMRHSLAHIMATAVMEIWPDAKLGVGPVVDDGFYYDIDLGDAHISEEDFEKIEAGMKKIIQEDQKFEKSEMPIDKALIWAKDNKQPYKEELLGDLKREGTTLASELDAATLGVGALSSAGGLGAVPAKAKVADVSFYTNGDFTDLCRGPHVASTGKVGAFKLTKVAGAFWRGKDDNPQMQRLYGVAFKTEDELNTYLEQLAEAIARDHRKLGKALDLFAFSDLVGSGLPLMTPRGTVLRQSLQNYSSQLRAAKGYQAVAIPHITKQVLYEKSGHWDKFGDELFLVKSQETSDQLVLKPMNCPHHIQIYASQPRSYRDLPIKYMENTVQYRDEKSGELHGLSRVRAISIDDNHAFIREDQIKDAVKDMLDAAEEMYKELDMELKHRLSFRDDSDAYLGDAKLWDKAQKVLEQLAKENKLDHFVEEGEAAFYGPKIDFIAKDSLGREWQVATVQLDFVQPKRFELEYTDSDGSSKTPVMIHTALLGSFERFLSVYIEHTAGQFPFWLAPEQIRIVTVNDSTDAYVKTITDQLDEIVLMKPLKYNELRYSVDSRNESLGKKIREAEVQKVPVTFIVGPKDEKSKQISVRTSEGEKKIEFSGLAEYIQGL